MKYQTTLFKIAIAMPVIALAFTIVGCKKVLDERALTSTQKSDYFDSPEAFQLAVNGLYAQLFDDKVWHGAAYVTMTFDDDDTQAGNSYRPGQDGTYDMVVRTADAWKGFNSLVQKANVLLDAVNNTTVLSEPAAKQIKGEALFIRGYSFLELGRRFGAIPLRLEPYVEGKSSQDICRDSLESVYLQAVSDMKTAADLLPESYYTGKYTNKDRGRPTKPAALGIMAKAYMHLAGAEVYGAAAGFYANPGKVQECYTKAAAAADQVRQLSQANGFPKLEADYMKPFDPATQNTSDEILFSVQGLTNVANKGVEIAFTLCPPVSGLSGTDGSGGGQVTLRWDFVGLFQPADKRVQWGKAIADSFFNAKAGENRWYYVYDPRTAIVATAQNGALPLGSTRASGTVPELPNVGTFSGANAGNYGWDKTIDINLPNNRGKVKSTPKLYSLKYTDPKANGKLDNGCDMIILRYSDILLLLAEAENEVNGPTNTALQAINEVRTRAGIGSITSGVSQTSFRDSVRLERRKELYFEFHRRWDLIRWGLFTKTMNDAKRPRQPYQNLYPLPVEELSANGCIKTNNPGY